MFVKFVDGCLVRLSLLCGVVSFVFGASLFLDFVVLVEFPGS